MLNYQAWLENTQVIRVLIAQVQVYTAGTTITRYISTHPVTVDGIGYLPIIKNNIDITDRINLDYTAAISFGDIELVNNNGEFDSWLNDIWVNKTCKVYYGGLVPGSTTLSLANDFQQIFDGVVEDIDSKSYTTLNLKIRDKLEKLNYPVTEAVLGNYYHGAVLADTDPTYTNQYRANIRPLVFGEVHNITPLLTDPTQLEYMVSNGPVEQIIEVLDNGVPVVFRTVKTATEIGAIPPGSFRLDRQPSGTITCSVQGVAKTINITAATFADTYKNTAANNIATILNLYGKTLSYAELDATSFSAVAQEGIGVYINDRTNLLQISQDIAKSCGCILNVTKLGVISLIKLVMPTSATVSITESDFILSSLNLTQKPAVVAGVKLGYAKNWTILTGLVTGIPEVHKNLYAQDYLEVTVKDTAKQTLYSVTTEPVLENSLLVDRVEATTVATNKLNLFSTQRKIVSLQCTAKFLSLEIGDAVQVTVNRFGIPAGSFGLVISTNPNWLTGKNNIEVLV